MLRQQASELIPVVECLATFLEDVSFPAENGELAGHPGITAFLAFALKDKGAFPARYVNFGLGLIFIENQKSSLPWVKRFIYRQECDTSFIGQDALIEKVGPDIAGRGVAIRCVFGCVAWLCSGWCGVACASEEGDKKDEVCLHEDQMIWQSLVIIAKVLKVS
jgi:hypothetical protein